MNSCAKEVLPNQGKFIQKSLLWVLGDAPLDFGRLGDEFLKKNSLWAIKVKKRLSFVALKKMFFGQTLKSNGLIKDKK